MASTPLGWEVPQTRRNASVELPHLCSGALYVTFGLPLFHLGILWSASHLLLRAAVVIGMVTASCMRVLHAWRVCSLFLTPALRALGLRYFTQTRRYGAACHLTKCFVCLMFLWLWIPACLLRDGNWLGAPLLLRRHSLPPSGLGFFAPYGEMMGGLVQFLWARLLILWVPSLLIAPMVPRRQTRPPTTQHLVLLRPLSTPRL